MGAYSHFPGFFTPRDFADLYAGRSNTFAEPEEDSASEAEEDLQQNTVPLTHKDIKEQINEAPEEIPATMGNSHSGAAVEQPESNIAEWSETDSGSDSSAELETPDVNKKLELLKDIEGRIDRFASKLERADTVREKLIVKLVVYVWMSKMNREFKFDRIGASKYRTSFGIITENLMKLLCELDDVQSRGNATIRMKRRTLVKQINDELLPKADRVLLKANKLVKVTEEVLGYSDAAKSAKKEQPSPAKEEPQKTEPMDVSERTLKPPQTKQSNKMEVSADKDEEKQHVNVEKPEQKKRERKSVPKFETSETRAAYLVRLRIPAGERAQDVRFALESNREMTISGKTFSLPVEIDPRKASLEESTYEFLDSRTVILRIPKRKRRVPAGYAQRNYTSPGFSNFGYQQNYRPTVWGW